MWKIKNQKNKNINPLNIKQKSKLILVDDQDRFEMDVEEDENGTYFFNSYDMNLLEHLQKLHQAGISSFKIEGRAKSVYYVAIVTRAYRKLLNAIQANKDDVKIAEIIKEQKKELNKLANRGYWTGFVMGDEPPHLLERASFEAKEMFVGISWEQEKSSKRQVFVHNHFFQGDKVEIITAKKIFPARIKKIFLEEKGEMDSAHGGVGRTYQIEFEQEVEGLFLMRKGAKSKIKKQKSK